MNTILDHTINMLAIKYKDMVDFMNEDASESDVKLMISHIENYDDPTIGTKVVRQSQLKRYLRETRPSWAKHVHFNPMDIERYHAINKERLRRRPNFVVRTEWIDKILGWFDSKKTGERLCALQLISGRRISEILESTFVVIDQTTLGCRDLSKKRNSDKMHFITLLHSYKTKEWMDRLNSTRKKTDKNSRDTNRVRANRALKREVSDGLTSHKLRGIYANLMWKLSGMVRIKTGFIQDALNLESQEIAIFYSSFIFE